MAIDDRWMNESPRSSDESYSVLEAIREGVWDFEPKDIDITQYPSTEEMPGTREKLNILALRAQQGLPLWHEEDRMAYDDGVDAPPVESI